MEEVNREDLTIRDNGYKKVFPSWIISPNLDQKESEDATVSDADGSSTSRIPSSSDTVIATSSMFSSATVSELAKSPRIESTPTKSPNRVSKIPSLRAKFKVFKSKDKIRNNDKTRLSGAIPSPSLPNQETKEASPTSPAHDRETHGNGSLALAPTITEFCWPTYTTSTAEPGMATLPHPQSLSALKFQPKQLLPQAPKESKSRPVATVTSSSSSSQGPPPAPSATADNPDSKYNTLSGNNSALSKSPNPMSANSGYSTSTTSDLADVPSRLPYHSPGYSPGYPAR